jgi:hypothetical protein
VNGDGAGEEAVREGEAATTWQWKEHACVAKACRPEARLLRGLLPACFQLNSTNQSSSESSQFMRRATVTWAVNMNKTKR